MQSQKAGNEPEQTESAVEDDVHSLGETFSFTRLIYTLQSEPVKESEAVAEDAQELSKWLSVVEDQLDDVSELTSIPSLQGLLERMESQAGRVVANELSAALTDGECHQLDELGRERLRRLCNDFHAQWRKMSPDQELARLHSRIQALETNNCFAPDASHVDSEFQKDGYYYYYYYYRCLIKNDHLYSVVA